MLRKLVSLLSFFKPIPVEENLSIDSYLGRWYQVATSRSTKFLGTGTDYRNVTAEYELSVNANLEKDVINVFNYGIDGNGNYTSIKGYSYTIGKQPTKRKVHFDGVPVDGNYWIVCLGPKKNNQYQYAIVSGPITTWFGTRFSLYVLARNINEYKTLYEKQVKKWCNENGFIYYWNQYVSTI